MWRASSVQPWWCPPQPAIQSECLGNASVHATYGTGIQMLLASPTQFGWWTHREPRFYSWRPSILRHCQMIRCGLTVGQWGNCHVVRCCILQTSTDLHGTLWSGHAQSKNSKRTWHDSREQFQYIDLCMHVKLWNCKRNTRTQFLAGFQRSLHRYRLGFHKLLLPSRRALPSWRARWRGQLVLVWKAVKGGTWPPGPSERQPLTFWDIFAFLNSLKWFSWYLVIAVYRCYRSPFWDARRFMAIPGIGDQGQLRDGL